jgi:hypothetical protein
LIPVRVTTFRRSTGQRCIGWEKSSSRCPEEGEEGEGRRGEGEGGRREEGRRDKGEGRVHTRSIHVTGAVDTVCYSHVVFVDCYFGARRMEKEGEGRKKGVYKGGKREGAYQSRSYSRTVCYSVVSNFVYCYFAAARRMEKEGKGREKERRNRGGRRRKKGEKREKGGEGREKGGSIPEPFIQQA